MSGQGTGSREPRPPLQPVFPLPSVSAPPCASPWLPRGSRKDTDSWRGCQGEGPHRIQELCSVTFIVWSPCCPSHSPARCSLASPAQPGPHSPQPLHRPTLHPCSLLSWASERLHRPQGSAALTSLKPCLFTPSLPTVVLPAPWSWSTLHRAPPTALFCTVSRML